MTEDIFDTSVGTLDVIVYAVLASEGVSEREGFYHRAHSTLDDICYRNARRLVNHFGRRTIAAIAIIREVSGLNLPTSRDAWLQVLESYELHDEHDRVCVRDFLEAERPDLAEYHIRKIRQRSGV